MATGKRFYWMKLKDSFMTSDTIDYFMSQPNGANYVVLYQMLCLKTINTGGRLSRQIGEVIIPFDVDKIVRDCKWFSVDTVRVALELYKAFGLVYEDTDGTLVLSNHNELVGSETDWAERKRVQRGTEQKALGMEIVHTNVHEENRDKEIKRLDIRDKELIDNTPPISPPSGGASARVRFLPPTVEQVREYCRERHNNVDPEQFVDFYTAKGWKVGAQSMKDWKAAVRTWEKRDGRATGQSQTESRKSYAQIAAEMEERGEI